MTKTFNYAVVPSNSKFLKKGYCRTLCGDIHDATRVCIELLLNTSIDWKIVEL